LLAALEAEGSPLPDRRKASSTKRRAQQAALSMHRTRDLPLKQCPQLVNMIRGLLAEFGIDIPKGLERVLLMARRTSMVKHQTCRLKLRRSSVPRSGWSNRLLVLDPNKITVLGQNCDVDRLGHRLS
jgi:transposase